MKLMFNVIMSVLIYQSFTGYDRIIPISDHSLEGFSVFFTRSLLHGAYTLHTKFLFRQFKMLAI